MTKIESLKYVKMDLNSRSRPVVVEVTQNDNYSRKIAMDLYSDDIAWLIPDGTTAVINYYNDHGRGGSYDTLPDGTTAYIIIRNQILITLSPDVMSAPGYTYLSVTLINGQNELSTFDIVINVLRKITGLLTDPDGNYANLTKETAIQLISGLLMGTQSGTPKHWLNVYALADLLVRGSESDVVLHTVKCTATNAVCHCGGVVAHGAGLIVEFEVSPGCTCKSVTVAMGGKEIVIDDWDYSGAAESDWTESCLSEIPEQFANWVKIYKVTDNVEINIVAE